MNKPAIDLSNPVQTMSSREIAELTGKRHPDVKRDIKVMLGQLGVDILKFQGIYLDSMNRKQTEYLLDEGNSLCLISGYSVKQRMAIINFWKELEAKQQTPGLSDDEIVSMAFAILHERIKKTEQTEDQAKADEREHWDDVE